MGFMVLNTRLKEEKEWWIGAANAIDMLLFFLR
jgi:hypothetical protein